MMMHPRGWRTAALGTTLLAAAVAAAGPAQADAPPKALAASDSYVAAPGPSADDYVAETGQAAAVVEAWWTKHWDEYFTAPFSPPAIGGFYDSTDPSDTTVCGGQKAPADNAAYCLPEDKLIWDHALMSSGYQKDDVFVWVVVAHEYGHAVAQRLYGTTQVGGSELQADCFAGAALAGAVADGLLTLELGDTQAISAVLAEIADDVPFSGGNDHGDPLERTGAFQAGRSGGVLACGVAAP